MKRWLPLLAPQGLSPASSAAGTALIELRLQYVPTYQEMRPAVEAELRRARRYERPMGLLMLALVHADLAGPPVHVEPPRNGRGNGNGNGASGPSRRPTEAWLDEQMSFMLLGELLRATLRESDIVAYAATTQRFLVCLPESDAAAARRAVDRIDGLVRQRTASALRVGAAAFPEDGLSLDDLVEHAQRGLLEPSAQGLTILREASHR